MSIDKDIDRLWNVTFYGKNGNRYRGNCNKNVIARTLEEACEKVKAAHEDAKFISVNHKGSVDL